MAVAHWWQQVIVTLVQYWLWQVVNGEPGPNVACIPLAHSDIEMVARDYKLEPSMLP